MEVLSSSFNVMLLLKGYFRKFSRNLELSEERKLEILLKNRHSDTKLFAAVSIGTKFAAYVAHSDFIVSRVLPACIQEAN